MKPFAPRRAAARASLGVVATFSVCFSYVAHLESTRN